MNMLPSSLRFRHRQSSLPVRRRRSLSLSRPRKNLGRFCSSSSTTRLGAAGTDADAGIVGGEGEGEGSLKLTCPVCFEVVHEVRTGGSGGGPGSGKARIVSAPERINCPGCSKKFRVSPGRNYFDLTVLPTQAHDDDAGSSVVNAVADALSQSTRGSGKSNGGDTSSSTFTAEKDLGNAYKEKLWSVSKLFQSPVISYVYERGWRQGFDWAGFPGADAEFDLLEKLYFGDNATTLQVEGNIGSEAKTEEKRSQRSVLDVSCGTGLFSRKFLKSGKFDTIVASDYSEEMLKQAYTFLEKEEDKCSDHDMNPSVLLVRADVGRLPFPSKTFDLVHAGAAIHCWPTPSLGMAEITRVLKPGGKMIGSTFLLSASPLGQRLGNDDFVRPLFELEKELSGGVLPALTGRNMRFWEERELKALCSLCGLDHFQVERDNRFIMFCATKPEKRHARQ